MKMFSMKFLLGCINCLSLDQKLLATLNIFMLSISPIWYIHMALKLAIKQNMAACCFYKIVSRASMGIEKTKAYEFN